MRESPDFSKVRLPRFPGVDMAGPEGYGEYLRTRDDLMFDVMQLMAESQLDAIVHRTVEHQPTLISEGVGPPYYNGRGVTHINTFLAYVPSISVPAGFTSAGLPVGITFLARPFNDGAVIKARLRLRAGHPPSASANHCAPAAGRAVGAALPAGDTSHQPGAAR